MRTSDIGILVLRLGVGTILAGHGVPKLLGGPGREPPSWLARLMGPNYKTAWERGGPENFGGVLAKVDVPYPTLVARASGLAELGGGAALALAAATPVAAAVVVANMAVAINKMHRKNGLYGPGGFEFPLAPALGAAAVGLSGPGAISVDRIAGRRS